MQPVIGITTCIDRKGIVREGVEYMYIRTEYGRAVRANGGQPIFLDPSIDPDAAMKLCDGLIISGGEDIHPSFYNETARNVVITEDKDRTAWELTLIEAADSANVPILGVCYGNQLLNVYYGGTLYQDIHKELGSTLNHGSSESQATHDVYFEQDFLGYKKDAVVPSAARHHQAVKDLAPGFSVVARAEDGAIEAIEGNGHYGIQWHGESDGTAALIYGEFIKLCNSEPQQLADFLPEAA